MAKTPNSEKSKQTRNVEILAPEPPDEADIIPAKYGGWLRPFKPGQSGNPGGVGKAYHEARRICAEATADAARKQVELMNSKDERVAFIATEAVLNRGAGKVRDHSNEDRSQRVDLSALSSDDRVTLAALLRKALGSPENG